MPGLLPKFMPTVLFKGAAALLCSALLCSAMLLFKEIPKLWLAGFILKLHIFLSAFYQIIKRQASIVCMFNS